jgi:uncharacterized protein YjaZ
VSIRIHILSENKSIRPYKDRLLRITNETLTKIKKLIPLKDLDIVLFHDPFGAIREIGGVGGYSPNAHLILVSLDPSNPHFSKNIQTSLSSTLAHESHHAVRWTNPGYGKTLLEALISEGLADHFDLEVFPEHKIPPWDKALGPKEKNRLSVKAKRLFNKTYNHGAWFIGSDAADIPRWTGYTLGYEIVKDYLQKHPSESASKLVKVSAKKIYKK